jgi:hypothetical protein
MLATYEKKLLLSVPNPILEKAQNYERCPWSRMQKLGVV